MLKAILKLTAPLCAAALMSACAAIVEPIELPGVSKNEGSQENFEVKVTPLTFTVAAKLNEETYARSVSVPGNGFSADVVSEASIARKGYPRGFGRAAYKLGVGDEIALVQYIEAETSLGAGALLGAAGSQGDQVVAAPLAAPSTPKVLTTSGRVGSDGSVLLIGIGRLEARGRELSALRDEVRNILIRNGKSPNFQLEIKGFNSQRAYLTTDTATTSVADNIFVLPITDQDVTLTQLLATAGVAFNERALTVLRIKRGNKFYEFKLADIFGPNAPDIYLRDKDHVFIKTLAYVDGKVFLVGGVQPSILKIKPEERQTLASALFAPGGPLATGSAQRSAVYLLRGRDPINAYHLDATSPARILVADSVELRPNDIIFVAEQPIITFNRTLATIVPLRILLRDIDNGNIP